MRGIGTVLILIAGTFAVPAAAFDFRAADKAGFPIPVARPAALTQADPVQKWGTTQICSQIAGAARRHGLPPEFFARLIWKESRFDIKALSPVGAQGIAQFMPQTARIRGLKDPWDPAQAIPASARFLADLQARFGNFGLAAAAYNGGPDRVAKFIARGGGWLPTETLNYVQSITFRPADWFLKPGRKVEHRPLEKGKSFAEACQRLPVIATRAMGGAVARAPWGVQIAAGINRRAALRAFKRARSRLRSVIGGRGAIIVRQRRGAVAKYSARVGASSRTAARKLCARIRRVGGACVVRRN